LSGEHESFEVELANVPVRPTSAREIRELEIALIIGTIFRPDVIKEILHPREFTTWLDSLAVAAGALAREKAGYPVSKIADELGRSETTVRNHLQGKTKAGQLVRQTYEMLVRGKLKLSIPAIAGVGAAGEVEKLKSEVEKLKNAVKEAAEKVKEAARILEEALS
jgi:probable regulatory domain-containing protein